MRGNLGVMVSCTVYLILGGMFGSTPLDEDEFTFVREPYELFGGDYTIGYFKDGEYANALQTAIKSYYFFWKYRPLNAPVISNEDRSLFNDEEVKFGYVKPAPIQAGEAPAVGSYEGRLIVPEPDRFYSHGAGKPLLPALLSIPQLAVLNVSGLGKAELLESQFEGKKSVVFLLSRLIQYLAGVVSIILVYTICKRTVSEDKARISTFIFFYFSTYYKIFSQLASRFNHGYVHSFHDVVYITETL